MADRTLTKPLEMAASAESYDEIASRSATSAATRQPHRFTTWGVALAAGWAAFAVVMFAPILWVSPSFLSDALPWLYKSVTSVMPGWFVPGGGPASGSPNPATLLMNVPPTWLAQHHWIGELLRRWTATLLFFGLMACLWASYLFAMRSVAREVGNRVRGEGEFLPHLHPIPSPYRVTRSPRSALLIVLVGGLVFGAITMLWMGMYSTDVYDYAIQGKMQAFHGLNPFIDPPKLIGHDKFLNLTPWRDKLTVYGPAMLLFVKLVTFVADPLGGQPVTYLLLYRALNVVLIALCTLLVWDIGKRLEWPKERLVVAVALFAWCPLMITELVGSAHNDSLLILCILGAVWLHLRGWWPLAMQVLVLGGMIKLSGYFLLPAYLVLLARTSRSWGEAARRVTGAVAVGSVVALFAFAPYFHPDLGASLLSNPMSGFVVNSPAAAVRTLLVNILMQLRGVVTPSDLEWRPALEMVRFPMWYGPILLWGLLMTAFSLRARDLNSLIRAWFLVLFSYLIVGSVWNWPWYANWLVPLLAIMPASQLRRAGLLLVFGSAICWGLYPIGIYLPGNHAQRLSYLYMPAVIFGPALVYLAWIWWQAIYNWWRQRVHAPRLQAAKANMG